MTTLEMKRHALEAARKAVHTACRTHNSDAPEVTASLCDYERAMDLYVNACLDETRAERRQAAGGAR